MVITYSTSRTPSSHSSRFIHIAISPTCTEGTNISPSPNSACCATPYTSYGKSVRHHLIRPPFSNTSCPHIRIRHYFKCHCRLPIVGSSFLEQSRLPTPPATLPPVPPVRRHCIICSPAPVINTTEPMN
jgi:hypothetical protein